jgi:hypothetical protein
MTEPIPDFATPRKCGICQEPANCWHFRPNRSRRNLPSHPSAKKLAVWCGLRVSAWSLSITWSPAHGATE